MGYELLHHCCSSYIGEVAHCCSPERRTGSTPIFVWLALLRLLSAFEFARSSTSNLIRLMNLDSSCHLNGRATKICMIQNSVPTNGTKLMMPKVVVSRGPCLSPNNVMFLAKMRENASEWHQAMVRWLNQKASQYLLENKNVILCILVCVPFF